MINIIPSFLGDRDAKFWEDFIVSIPGEQAASVAAVPFANAQQVSVPGGLASSYFDIATTQVLAGYDAKAIYVGALYVKTYCSAFAVAGDVELLMYTGDANAYSIERRAIAAVDATWGKDREFPYNPTSFSHFRVNKSGGFNGTIVVNLSFVGVKISF
jgi:hypothetical protein